MTRGQLLRKVRQFCSECVGGVRMSENVWPVKNPKDIEECCAPECGWFPYRFGKDPEKNPARVEAGRRLHSVRE